MPRLVPARLLAALKPEARARLELPADLLHESRRRVRIAAALGAGAYAIFLAFLLTRVVESSVYEHRIDLAHDVLGVVLCGSLLVISGLRSFSDRATRMNS